MIKIKKTIIKKIRTYKAKKETELLFSKYFGSAKIYGSTKEIDDYIRECVEDWLCIFLSIDLS